MISLFTFRIDLWYKIYSRFIIVKCILIVVFKYIFQLLKGQSMLSSCGQPTLTNDL